MLKIMCFVFFVNDIWCAAELLPESHGKYPFFELSCMRLGGTCAKPLACPLGTKVGQRGLCPEQKLFGIECCRHFDGVKTCEQKGGKCVIKEEKCAKYLRIHDADADCASDEICCFQLTKVI